MRQRRTACVSRAAALAGSFAVGRACARRPVIHPAKRRQDASCHLRVGAWPPIAPSIPAPTATTPYAAAASPQTAGMGVAKLSHQLFSLLESKFLFGAPGGGCLSSGPGTPARAFLDGGRVRVLAIDGCGADAEDALLAAAALARLEARLRKETGDPDARVADFFDVAAGAGAGGVLAAMLFLRGGDGRPRYSAEEALAFVAGSVGGKDWGGRRGRWSKIFRGSRSGDSMLQRVFGDATLRDTVAPLLVPCYDLATAAPFVFSRADAVESDTFDFRLRDVCAATCAAGRGPIAMRSIDGLTAIAAASAGVAAMGNPAAAAITHVLHNKQEFPLATGVDDLLVLSIGAGAGGSNSVSGASNTPMPTRSPSSRELARVTAQGVADMVDESVAMAFGHTFGSNYVRIQADKAPTPLHVGNAAAAAGAMLAQRNVESVLFRGRRLSERTNAEKVDALAAELVKEQERRRRSPLPNVAIKLVGTPRLSSATTSSSGSATARTASTMLSPASWDSRR
ncbi:Patatin-like protein 3 [Dichanthelium oligosanthes]|uniref:Patatin n=1 Tax=Dichanthelium oligosanthes TaxID=888268 RepID=A0A1E5WA96_9POAL|nr:Patatin-like protein 3 [Dichanthelium oligosanthes]